MTISNAIILWGVFTTVEFSWACRPAPGYVAPTQEENFNTADRVFLGKVLSKADGEKVRLVIETEKFWKGKSDPKVSAFSEPSSCDRFGYDVSIGSKCIFFVKKDNSIIGNGLSGEASVCEESGNQKALQMVDEFERKLKLKK